MVQVIATAGDAKFDTFKFKVEIYQHQCKVAKMTDPMIDGKPNKEFFVK